MREWLINIKVVEIENRAIEEFRHSHSEFTDDDCDASHVGSLDGIVEDIRHAAVVYPGLLFQPVLSHLLLPKNLTDSYGEGLIEGHV